LEEVVDRTKAYADTAYRSAKNEERLLRRGFVSRIHRKKPTGKPMPERTRFANARKSKVRSAVERVFAHQKGLMGLFVQTIGLARTRLKIARQSRQQYAPLCLAERARRHRVTNEGQHWPSLTKRRRPGSPKSLLLPERERVP
jgi:IS5 family transposase